MLLVAGSLAGLNQAGIAQAQWKKEKKNAINVHSHLFEHSWSLPSSASAELIELWVY